MQSSSQVEDHASQKSVPANEKHIWMTFYVIPPEILIQVYEYQSARECIHLKHLSQRRDHSSWLSILACGIGNKTRELHRSGE